VLGPHRTTAAAAHTVTLPRRPWQRSRRWQQEEASIVKVCVVKYGCGIWYRGLCTVCTFDRVDFNLLIIDEIVSSLSRTVTISYYSIHDVISISRHPGAATGIAAIRMLVAGTLLEPRGQMLLPMLVRFLEV
jgi:hypothetical protein